MHKSVVALLVAAAIADGAIGSADDPIGDYLPAWRNDPRGAISLRDVLTMTSGLEPFSREGGFNSPGWSYVQGPGDARAETLGRPLVRKPGTVFHYSGFNSQLLLMVIEAATGRSYIDYLSERLWQPLGNSDAWLWMYDEPEPMPRAFTALMASAEDWLRIGLLVKDFGRYAGQQLIPAELIQEMTAPSAAYANYGWQLWLGTEHEQMRYYNRSGEGVGIKSEEPFVANDMIYFDGIGGQRVYISRSLDLVIVRQGDRRLDWDDSLLPNLVIRAAEGAEGS
ncbi:MAG: CubicO group peptidase (beta-lactamase class C family) [Halieaceae bacterium]|jgi:CubicO group peptidase (beta-lactamase class C family)